MFYTEEELINEEWKSISCIEGLEEYGHYYISNLGRLKRRLKDGTFSLLKGFMASPCYNIGKKYKTRKSDKTDYLSYKNHRYCITAPKKKAKNIEAHILVAKAFIPNPNNYPIVRHFPDKSTTNNKVSNLLWGTAKDNANDAIYHRVMGIKDEIN